MLEKKIQCKFIILMEHINDIYSRGAEQPRRTRPSSGTSPCLPAYAITQFVAHYPSSWLLELRERCEAGERRACVRLGIIIENRERRAAWRREHPEVFFYESER
jgi:hypothetical protein